MVSSSSAGSGIGSAGSAHASQRLRELGWRPHAVLAHRFHLSLASALLWGHLQAPALGAVEARIIGRPGSRERATASQPVGEMANRQRIGLRCIISEEHIEIARHEESGA